MSSPMLRLLVAAVLCSSAALAAPPEGKLPKGWILHTVKEEGFQVALPQQPTLRRRTMQTEVGPAQITAWMVQRGHDELVVGVSHFAPGVIRGSLAEPGALLESSLNEMVNGFRATVQSDKSLQMQGPPGSSSSYPAREVQLLLPEGTRVTARLVLAGERLITFVYASKGTSNKSFHRMVGSFAFL